MAGRLTEGFRDIIELRWDEFVALEADQNGTNFDSIVTAIARASMKGNLRAIQTALDRLDGKVATEIEVEYPKFYTLYPRATRAADDKSIIDGDDRDFSPEPVKSISEIGLLNKTEPTEEELPTGSLRAVLEKMLDSPKQIVIDILARAGEVDNGDKSKGNPTVKSVIVAGLMKLVHDGRIGAVFEVFDQIDGRVADKYKILGGDVYLQNYSTIAPSGAYLNGNGIYQVEANNTTDSWAARLEQSTKKGIR